MSNLTSTLRLAGLFARRTETDSRSRLLTILPIASFAIVTALLLLVVGGARALIAIGTVNAGMYQLLTAIALSLLVVPMITLGAAAAKLAARRRDARLSSLRLLGATTGQVKTLAIVESAAGALSGAFIGSAIYAALVPLVGMFSFGGAPLGSRLWLPLWGVPAAWAFVTLLAVGSAALGLREVALSPLGVRTRQRAGRVRHRRLLIAAVLVVTGISMVLGLQALTQVGGFAGLLVAVTVAFACGLLALDAIGPWYVAMRARVALVRADNVERLLAARMVLEDPLVAWRQVSGLAVSTFVGVIAAGGSGLFSLVGHGATDPDLVTLFSDMRTGVYLTLGIAFVMVAASVAINQAANTLDRARVQVSLDRLGVPRQLLAAASRRSVMMTVLAVVVGAGALAVALNLPLIGAVALTTPVSIITMLITFTLGVLVVRFGASVAGSLVPGILAHPDRVL